MGQRASYKKSRCPILLVDIVKYPILVSQLPAIWRTRIAMLLVSAAFASLIFRAFWLQIVHSDFYVVQGQKRYQRTIKLDATRGCIIDRNGALLAVSLATYEIWATPKLVETSAYAPLAKLLNISVDELNCRLRNDKLFVLLKRQVDTETVARIDQFGFAGITRIADSKRFYPEGESTAHVIGFTDIQDNGQEGVELAVNTQLSGTSGHREVIRDCLGRIISESQACMPPRNGNTIQLTIDRRIQQLAYVQLKNAIQKHNAQAGSIVVLDAHNGDILALTNWPSFDPNNHLTRIARKQLRNRAVVDTFEPGSTIKPVLIALAIDEHKVHPQTIIDTSPGTWQIGRSIIHDTSNHGRMTVAEALQKSSNIALAKLAMNFSAKTIWSKYQQYGIGQKPVLNFPGIASGRLRPYQHWSPIEQATMAYGYGLSMSLLQIAQIYTAYVDNGMLHPAKLLRGDIPKASNIYSHAVTTPATASAIRLMLEMATSPHGTGHAANVPDYRVGGKTGTTRKQIGSSYAKNRYRSLFVGMAPMSNPCVIVAVMIDDPAGQTFYGGTVAAPVFAQVTNGVLKLLGVPPNT